MDFKYHNRRIYSTFFAREIIFQHKRILQDWHMDAIIPVPVHKNKQKKRGYNQADLLAKDLSFLLNLPYYSNLLIRTIDTLPQKQFSPQARLNNIQKAFCIHPRRRDVIKNLNTILLIDDIYTTGATMEACTRILRKAGVKQVYIYSVCIGLSKDG